MDYACRILLPLVLFLSIACHDNSGDRNADPVKPVVAELPGDTGTGNAVETDSGPTVGTDSDSGTSTGTDADTVAESDSSMATTVDTSTATAMDTATTTESYRDSDSDSEPESPNYCTTYAHQLDATVTDDGGVVLTLQVDDADETLVATVGAAADAAEIQIASEDTERVLMVTVAADGSVVSVNRVEAASAAENVDDEESVDSDGTPETAIDIFSTPQPDGVGCAELTQLNAQQTDSGRDVLVMVRLKELLTADTDASDTDSLDTDSALECHFAFADDSDTEPAEGALEWNSLFYHLRLDDSGSLVEKTRLVNATDATPVYGDFHNGGTTLAMNAVAMAWGEAVPVEIRKDERFPGTQTGAIGRFDADHQLIDAVETSPLNGVFRAQSGELLLQIQNSFLLFGSLSTSSPVVSWINKNARGVDRGIIHIDERYFLTGESGDVFGTISEDLYPQRMLGGDGNTFLNQTKDTVWEVVEVGPELDAVDIGLGQTSISLSGMPNKSVYYLVSRSVLSAGTSDAVTALAIGPQDVDPDCVQQDQWTYDEMQCPVSEYVDYYDAKNAASAFHSSSLWIPAVAEAWQMALGWLDQTCLVRCAFDEECAVKAECETESGVSVFFSWRAASFFEENIWGYNEGWEHREHELVLEVTRSDEAGSWTDISLNDEYSHVWSLPDFYIYNGDSSDTTEYTSLVSWQGSIDDRLPLTGFHEYLIDKSDWRMGSAESGSQNRNERAFPDCSVGYGDSSSYMVPLYSSKKWADFNGTRYSESSNYDESQTDF